MGAHSFEDLKKHYGHDVVVMLYGDNNDPQNVSIECLDCNEVLVDFDKTEEE